MWDADLKWISLLLEITSAKRVAQLHALVISLLCMHWLCFNLGFLAKITQFYYSIL